jgi:hypothetical protein
MTTIPTTLDRLTPSWLTEALAAGGRVGAPRVTAASVAPVGQGVGVLCQLARVTLAYDGAPAGAPATLVAKLATAEPQTRGMVSLFRFYEREVRFYDELAAGVPVATPRCFFSAFDPASGDFVLLLEDLGGARIGDQLAACTPEEAALVVDEASKLHAAWWRSPRLGGIPWMPAINDEVNKLGLGLYPQAWGIFLERFGAGLPAAMRAGGERLGAHIPALLDGLAVDSPTVCHGDLRLDNLFFGAGAAALTLIDWQIAGRGIGTYDVGYFMSQSLAPDVRRACERDVLRRYHASLVARGVRDYPFEQCLADYRLAVLFCFVYPVMAGGLGDLSNERGHALAAAMAERSSAAILDWRALDLLA